MSKAPILIRNHFSRAYGPDPLLLVHGDRVHAPQPAAAALVGAFTSDGAGGFVAAARAVDEKCGYLDGEGRWVIEPTLEAAFGFSMDGMSRFCRDRRWGFLDLACQIVIAPRFEDALGFQHGLAPVMADGQWRYVDRGGNVVVQQGFGYAQCFNEAGVAVAGAGRRKALGVIDRTGNWVIPPRFTHVLPFGTHGVTAASADGKQYGLIDTAGRWVMKPSVDHIGSFNDHGLAHFSDWVSGRHGYLDTAGRTVMEGGYRLAKTMVAGFALDGDDRFRNADGELRTSDPISWTTPFTVHGFAIAKRSDHDGHDNDAIQSWGLLRSDGTFIPAPPEVAEPLTDSDGMIVWPERGTPLAAFATHDGNVALMNAAGTIAYRLQREQAGAGQVPVLRNGAGDELWRGEPAEWLRPKGNFFTAPAEFFLEGLDSVDDIDATVDAMMAHTEARLHAFAAGQLQDGEDADENEDEDEDDDEYGDEDDEPDPWSAAATLIGQKKRIFDSYLDETVWGAYEFLGYHRETLGKQVAQELIARLSARFGAPDPEMDITYRVSDWKMPCWAIALPRPIGDGSGAHGATLWIGIEAIADTGDGDIWFHINLHCYPDPITLKAAMRAAGMPVEGEDGA